MFIGIIIVFILPDFPHTWKLLSPELKMVANRRMAIDAAEADLDEAGGMSHVRGMKLALTDPKACLMLLFKGLYGTADSGYDRLILSLSCTIASLARLAFNFSFQRSRRLLDITTPSRCCS